MLPAPALSSQEKISVLEDGGGKILNIKSVAFTVGLRPRANNRVGPSLKVYFLLIDTILSKLLDKFYPLFKSSVTLINVVWNI